MKMMGVKVLVSQAMGATAMNPNAFNLIVDAVAYLE
jgi:hypothetical protein